MNIFCYRPQVKAVLALLQPYMASGGAVKLVPIDEHNTDKVRGLEDVTFVMVTHHPDRIPQRIYELLYASGVVVWHLDDSRRRGRA